MLKYDYSGYVAFVTGASSGMGEATARRYAEAGAAVALVDLSDGAVEEFAAELTSREHEALALRCDVSNEQEVADAVTRTVEEFGRLDVAFNNAGIMIPPADAADEPAEAFDAVNSVNLRGVWTSMKHELAQMRAQGGGAIVNCSSLGGLVGGAGRASYHATKHGVLGLTKSVALQYAPHGVRVNAVCPGTIATPMVERMSGADELDLGATLAVTPMARLGTADEIADAVLWLTSSAASYITGVALPVDGGYTAQ